MRSPFELLRRLIVDTWIWYAKGGVALARSKGVTVGEGCRIYIRAFGTEPFLVTIGDRVTITSGVRLITHDGSTWLVRDADGRRYQRYAGVTVGDDVFIGVDSIVMPGVTIGSRVVIGAGSVVTADCVGGSVYAGNPARRIGDFDRFDAKIRGTCVNDREIEGIADYQTRVHEAIRLAGEKTRTPET